MGKNKTSSIFYRRGIPNNNPYFGSLVNGNYSIVQPIRLFQLQKQYNIVQPQLITQGQILYLDAGNKNSYTGIGSNWKNLGSGGNIFDTTLFNSPIFINNNNSSYFSFNGTNQYGQLLRPVQDNFSLCVVFKTTQIAGDDNSPQWYANGNPQIIGGDQNGTTNDYGISIGIGTLFFGTGFAGNNDVTIKSILNTYNDGKWHYLVAARNMYNAELNLYIDGILNSTGYNSIGVPLDASPIIRIASEAFQYSNFFNGNIAIVQAYNRVLSQGEINYNYNIIKTRYT